VGRGSGGGTPPPAAPYRVTVTLRVPGQPEVVTAGAYAAPGTFSLSLPVPRTRGRGVVTVRLQDAFGLVSEDAYPLAFHVRYQRLLKWLLVGPFTAMALALATAGAATPGGALGGLGGAAAPWGTPRAAQD